MVVLKCFYCKAVIDKKKDYCRCCKEFLEIFPCPGCYGSMYVRCFREECAEKASEQGSCQCQCKEYGDIVIGKEFFFRTDCALCTYICIWENWIVSNENRISIDRPENKAFGRECQSCIVDEKIKKHFHVRNYDKERWEKIGDLTNSS